MKYHYFRAITNKNCGNDMPADWEVKQEGWLNGSSRANPKRCSEAGCNAIISLTTMCEECLRSKHNLEVKLSEHLNKDKKRADWRGFGLYAVKPASGPYKRSKRGPNSGKIIVFTQDKSDIIIYGGDKLTRDELGMSL